MPNIEFSPFSLNPRHKSRSHLASSAGLVSHEGNLVSSIDTLKPLGALQNSAGSHPYGVFPTHAQGVLSLIHTGQAENVKKIAPVKAEMKQSPAVQSKHHMGEGVIGFDKTPWGMGRENTIWMASS
ncbi:hypothetical protein EDC04DRAFT_2614109 [Pisolithus marmoratus]|nr:hypothetical protein EDC04DRAFT_2614109 [Pisolithus marmoratus]